MISEFHKRIKEIRFYLTRKDGKPEDRFAAPAARGGKLAFALLFFFALGLSAAASSQAAGVMCSEFYENGVQGVVNGYNPTTYATVASASTFGIDMNCTIENFPLSIGGFPINNLNFQFWGNSTFYIVFDNVWYGGNMSCNNPSQATFWIYWAPGGYNNISSACQAFMVPVDAVQKKNPPAQTTAVIGVPFTYTITAPLLGQLDSTGTFKYMANADSNDINNAVITDDLTASGAALTYISNTAYLVNPGTGTRTPLGSLVNSGTNKNLTFSYANNPALITIQAGYNIEIDLTVVLDNNPSNVNLAGTQFSNTAGMSFDKTINSTDLTGLHAWLGTTLPMSVIEPNLTLTKTGSVSTANMDSQVKYTLNVQNTGGVDAWNAVITDNIPAGMCTYSPLSSVTAQIYASDGTTLISNLVNGTDYQVSWNGGGSSACQLTLTMLDTTKIAPTQRLIIKYQGQVDSTGIASGTTLTNIAGATRWFSANSTYAGRRQYDKTLSDGTPGTLDFQDTWTVTAALAGYYFQKTVLDLTTGAYPATAAFSGDRLRYTLLLQNFTWPTLSNIAMSEDIGALNASAVFVPGSLSVNAAGTTLPAGSYSVCPTCGTNGAGTITINSASGLSLASNQQYQIQFDVTLASPLTDGTNVLNQATLSGTDSFSATWSGPSDDPYINGTVLLGSGGEATPVLIQAPGALSKAINQSTATIGQQFSYTITVPATPTNVPLYDVRILDNLGLSAANMTFVSAQVISGGAWNLTNTGTAANIILQDLNTGIDIPAGGQAVIQVTVALQNTTINHSGVTFTNSASYTYNKINGNSLTQATGGSATTSNMTVVEPQLTAVKTVSYASPAGKLIMDPANANDVLQYVVTVTNNGTSTAFDADIMDFLPSNVSLVPGSPTVQINGSPDTSFIATPTVLASGALDWGHQNGDTSFDIPAAGTLVLTYQVRVLEVNGTSITNNVYASWTSLSGVVAGERTGAGCPTSTSPNNYCTGPATTSVSSVDPTKLAKSVVSDTWNTGLGTGTDSILRVGDTVVYSLALTLREGVTQNVVLSDTLPAGLAFDSLVSITPATGGNFTYAVASQPAPGATGTLTWNLGNISNTVDNDLTNNSIIIQYRAKVFKNTLAQTPATQALTNNAVLNYAINGTAATQNTSVTVNVKQPVLNISKSAVPAGGGTVISAGEFITYTLNIANTGDAPAYNTVLTDTLPLGLRQNGVTMQSITLINTATSAVVTSFPSPLAPSYNSTTGLATWNFDVSGQPDLYAVPPGDTLQVVYRVKADATLGAGMTLVNNALVQNYYSFDSQDVPANSTVTDRQVYGPTGAATVQLTTAAATALSKQALVTAAAIGQPFTYEITIPASAQPTAMYDVQVLDDISLATTGVAMGYVSSSAHLKSGARTWATLTNSGTAANLILKDTVNGGLDIPAGDQLVVDVVVVLNNDTVNNTPGKQFQNTANYKYNSVDNDNTTQANGAPGASGPVTIVAPDLTMTKSGPATMHVGAPGAFTLSVQNIGGAPAWNTALTDTLPNVTNPPGGMCGSAPTNVTARVYQTDGTTPVSAVLVNGTDFTVSFAGAPSCSLTLVMNSAAAVIPPTDRLIVTYNASLDTGTAGAITLTNVAGATQWVSADPAVTGAAGNVHTYTNVLTNGTPGVLDFQDAFNVTTQAPVLTFTKTVYDVTTSQSGATARPGDTLKYTVTIQNVSTLNATNFSLTDELDKLNLTAMFVPGSLTLLTVPAGANTSLTSGTGGTKGTGLVSVGSLNIDAQGGANDKLVIEFQARLVPVITSGTKVLNQAQIGSITLPSMVSDDPAQSGATDPTLTTITSAPVFRVQKTVQDVTSGTSFVKAGDTLRYTIKVNNIGTENAVSVTLRDLVPANTTYVAGSTTLNGVPVSDPSVGVSALQNGMSINAPANLTPGVMPADVNAAASNTATIVFDVKISANVVEGTIISNQGFVDGSGAGSGSFPEQRSDDPATPVVNDPTSVVVGNLPLVYALKTVKLVTDNNGNGLVDPGDVLRYTITLTDSAATPAAGVILTDTVPANTTYVANSTTLNGVGVADPGAGVSPLANGMGVVSSGLTPPSPVSSGGTLAAHGTGIVTIDVQVNGGVTSGTIISNQGTVATTQLPQLTDSDGDPTNGYQPTVITVGNAQQLTLIKSYAVIGGGAPLPGSVVEYTVQATNVGTVPATGVVITDDLNPISTQVAYVAGSATMNGSVNGVTYASQVITADYGTTYGALAPGSSVSLRFRAALSSAITGTPVTNTAQAAWNTPAQTTAASVTLIPGSLPGSLNGHVWLDANLNNIPDSGEVNLAGWAVDAYRDGQLLGTVYTAADGAYHVNGLAANGGTPSRYELRFRAAGAGPSTAMQGWGDSPFTNGMQRISNIILPSGGSLQNLNLPLTPNGVVYNSITRLPVAGATLTMVDVSTKTPLPGSCFNDTAQQGQVTMNGGYYKFDLNFNDPSCPSGGSYLIQVTPPASGYTAGSSKLIPPTSSATTAAFSVPTCPGGPADAVPSTMSYCEAQSSAVAPPLSVPVGTGTAYYLYLTLAQNNALPAAGQIYNNHIAIDPTLNTAIAITKTSAMVNVTRSQLVPYTITLRNTLGVTLQNLSVVDTFPPGFKYVAGSGRVDGQKMEPAMTTKQLSWSISQLISNTDHTINLLLIAGSGVSEGEYVNRAQVMNNITGGAASGVASATVRVTPDPTMDCTDIIGKVFDDKNLNGYQDEGEKGLQGVKIVSTSGLIMTTDKYGRFHLTCAAVPSEERGSNFILKLDDRTLPTGYRVTTENPLVLRATRGKAMKFNFGATLHRVVRLDIADGVFEPGSTVMRPQWKPRIGLLLDELHKAPSVLRISYLADVEDPKVVKARAEAVKSEIARRWEHVRYRLTIETEIYWRRGKPL